MTSNKNKSAGEALCTGGCNLNLNRKDSVHSVEINKIFHISYHSFPKKYNLARQILYYMIFIAWILFVPNPYKLRAIFGATAYSFIEYAFTFLNNGKAYTSFAQYFGNLIYVPILLDGYGFLFYHNKYIYVLLFPFNIWLLEIVLDNIFQAIYGRNVAWCYHSYKDSKLNGIIRIGHGKFWVLLGIACYIIYPPLRHFTDNVF
jgi:hypothetical protein